MRDYQSIDLPEREARRAPAKGRSRRRTSTSAASNPRKRATSPKVLTRIPSLATADPLIRRESAAAEGQPRLLNSWISTRILAGGMAVLLGAAVITAVYQFSRDREDKKDEPLQSAQASSPRADVPPSSTAETPLWDRTRNEGSAWQAGVRPEEPSDGIGQSSGPFSPNPPAMPTTYRESLEPGGAPAPGYGDYQPPMAANRAMAIADRASPGAAGPYQAHASPGGYGTSHPSIPDQASMWLDYQDYAAMAALQGPTLATETARAAAAARLQDHSRPASSQQAGPLSYADRGGAARHLPAGSMPASRRAATSYGSGDPSLAYPPRYPSTGYPPADVVTGGSAAPQPAADVSAPAANPDVARFEGTIQKPPVQTTYERTRSSLY